MKSLALWVTPPYQNDEIFKPESPMNRDDCLAPFATLHAKLSAQGWSCHTQDVFLARNEVPTDVLFTDMPGGDVATVLGAWADKVRSHLLIQECEVVLPRNWNFKLHEQFQTIFTWHPDLIAKNGKYIEVNFAQKLRPPPDGRPFEQRKLCTLIAGNKGSSHPLELYSKRVEAIRYFEKNAPDSFDLFGMGWDKLQHSGILFKVLNKIPQLASLLAPHFPSYLGKVRNKAETLQTYRFAICFENAREIPGYVTEKIFDCLLAGCVPVYWGAPDIAERIPRECFIDFRNFDSFSSLHKHLENFSRTDFEKFLTATRAFVSSESARRYSVDFFADSIARGLSRS